MDGKPTQPASYYDVLRVRPSATDSEIKRAYRELAMIYHPDRNPGKRRMAELKFRVINEAYSELKTKEKRLRYNRILRQQKYKAKNVKIGNDNAEANAGWLGSLATFFSPLNKNRSNRSHGR